MYSYYAVTLFSHNCFVCVIDELMILACFDDEDNPLLCLLHTDITCMPSRSLYSTHTHTPHHRHYKISSIGLLALCKYSSVSKVIHGNWPRQVLKSRGRRAIKFKTEARPTTTSIQQGLEQTKSHLDTKPSNIKRVFFLPLGLERADDDTHPTHFS